MDTASQALTATGYCVSKPVAVGVLRYCVVVTFSDRPYGAVFPLLQPSTDAVQTHTHSQAHTLLPHDSSAVSKLVPSIKEVCTSFNIFIFFPSVCLFLHLSLYFAKL